MTSVVDAPLGDAAPTSKVGAASPRPERTRGRHAAGRRELEEPSTLQPAVVRAVTPAVTPAVTAAVAPVERPRVSAALLQRVSVDRPDWGPTTFGPTTVAASTLTNVSQYEPRSDVVLPDVVLPEVVPAEVVVPEFARPAVSLNRASEVALEQAPAFVRALIEDPQVQQQLAAEQAGNTERSEAAERAMIRAKPEQLALESKEAARYRARHSAPPSLAAHLSHVGTFFIRRGFSIGVSVALLATIAGILFCFVGAAMGYRGAVVLSGSMRPTMQVGALVISRSVTPEELHPGDLVTFRSPAVHNQSVTHRVVSLHRDGANMDFETRGDANKVSEHWQVPVNSKLGLGVFHINHVGRWLAALGSSLGRSIAVLLIAGVALTLILRRLWRAEPEQ
ncbi:signal peptidase I [Jatrophihabitans sp. GAS493]|uniref:signal peptidase I n=1 Tax=Jatrophihabitans sp. GAS493 TaxID=1907575 RepID=UPI000BB91CF4|nr:signal peptidase I [Jatrophihabitans sp. GAS493]SOD71294.1 signal peptidase I [Jatrophihabitans sp. GAS493]